MSEAGDSLFFGAMVKTGEGRLLRTDCPAALAAAGVAMVTLVGVVMTVLVGEAAAMTLVPAEAGRLAALMKAGMDTLLETGVVGGVTLTARPICSEKSKVTGWPFSWAARGANCTVRRNLWIWRLFLISLNLPKTLSLVEVRRSK